VSVNLRSIGRSRTSLAACDRKRRNAESDSGGKTACGASSLMYGKRVDHALADPRFPRLVLTSN